VRTYKFLFKQAAKEAIGTMEKYRRKKGLRIWISMANKAWPITKTPQPNKQIYY
jgi:hypothetical protein